MYADAVVLRQSFTGTCPPPLPEGLFLPAAATGEPGCEGTFPDTSLDEDAKIVGVETFIIPWLWLSLALMVRLLSLHPNTGFAPIDSLRCEFVFTPAAAAVAGLCLPDVLSSLASFLVTLPVTVTNTSVVLLL
jgi:hypothetical protein